MGINRRFRFDYYIPEVNVVLEINGGVYINGRHTFGQGYEKDLQKSNLSQKIGLKYYQFTYNMLKNKEYIYFI